MRPSKTKTTRDYLLHLFIVGFQELKRNVEKMAKFCAIFAAMEPGTEENSCHQIKEKIF